MKSYYLICRNADCPFAKRNAQEKGVEHYCPACSERLIWLCPDCERPLRNLEKGFCSYCKAPLEIRKEESAA